MGILRQPLEAFAVFRDTHFEIACKLVRRKPVRAAQHCSPSPVGSRESGHGLWLFRIVSVAREIRWNVELKLTVEQTNCRSSRSGTRRTTVARIAGALFASQFRIEFVSHLEVGLGTGLIAFCLLSNSSIVVRARVIGFELDCACVISNSA